MWNIRCKKNTSQQQTLNPMFILDICQTFTKVIDWANRVQIISEFRYRKKERSQPRNSSLLSHYTFVKNPTSIQSICHKSLVQRILPIRVCHHHPASGNCRCNVTILQLFEIKKRSLAHISKWRWGFLFFFCYRINIFHCAYWFFNLFALVCFNWK